MARKFAKAFYHSKAWLCCRQSYIDSMPKDRRGLCEMCYDKGLHVKGEELHHKIWLTPNNINDPKVTLNHKNLIFLCKDCHKAIHRPKPKRKYYFNELGELVPAETESPPSKNDDKA